MDTRTLSYIIAIAEEKSISKAAERLYMAQSSLSQYLTTLETSLGYPLFVRRHQGVRLTEAGKLYLEFAYRTINAYHQVQDAMQDISELHSGQVILGVSTFRGSYLLPPVITAFANKYPGVHVNIVEGDSVDLEYMLQRGDLDLALLVLGKAAKNLDSAFLMDDEICLIAHPHHPIMKKVRKGTRHNLQETPPWFIDIHEISQYEFILSGYDTILGKKAREIFARHHISPIVHNENLSALFAPSSSTVLITGESGTGKEMVATSIWREGSRKEGRFIALNCAAIPENLMESELFGYVKGAFTGADPNGRMGKFELANGGVIFLDEIGDMPLYLQSKLLRVLQERQIVRIGSNQLVDIDVRVIAATNKDLKKMVEEKQFREDLYYRLNVIPIHIEPLRNRKEDIEELSVHYIRRFSSLLGKSEPRITEDLMETLKRYPWPGNVRELENVMEYMVNLAVPGGDLDVDLLPKEMRKTPNQDAHVAASDLGIEAPIVPLVELEEAAIRRALLRYGRSGEGKLKAAQALGLSKATLYRKIKEYGV